jgi:hypothetical protein
MRELTFPVLIPTRARSSIAERDVMQKPRDDMMESSVGLYLRRREFDLLVQMINARWGIRPSESSLELIRELAFERPAQVMGGTAESPWSSATWLLWMKNRLDELARNPTIADDPASRYGTKFELEREPANAAAWQTFLQRFSDELLETEQLGLWYEVPDEAREARWMGFAPATELEIKVAEQRLGRNLPPSQRTFYAVSNGWRATGFFAHDYLPVSEIGWLKDREPLLFDLASEAENTPGPFHNDPDDRRLKQYRDEEGTRAKRSLVVNSCGDIWLLDPGAEPHSEEWPASCWAESGPELTWDVKNFAELMVNALRSLLNLQDRP